MQMQHQSLELLRHRVCTVKVQNQLKKTRTTKFAQTQTRQASNENGSKEKNNEYGSNEKGRQGKARKQVCCTKEKSTHEGFQVLSR